MFRLMIVVLCLSFLILTGCADNAVIIEPEPLPDTLTPPDLVITDPLPEKIRARLTGYVWVTSKHVAKGKAVLLLMHTLTGKVLSVKVNGEDFMYYGLYNPGNSEVWYGTKSTAEYGMALIEVETTAFVLTTIER